MTDDETFTVEWELSPDQYMCLVEAALKAVDAVQMEVMAGAAPPRELVEMRGLAMELADIPDDLDDTCKRRAQQRYPDVAVTDVSRPTEALRDAADAGDTGADIDIE
jgi:hypothetical protein